MAGNYTDTSLIDNGEPLNAAPVRDAIDALDQKLYDFATGAAILTAPDINGGTIDGSVIGATTPASGAFTSISASSNASSLARVNIDGAAGTLRMLLWRTGTSARFALYTSNAAETGSNVGSDLTMLRYLDNGTSSPVLNVERSTGIITIPTLTVGTMTITDPATARLTLSSPPGEEKEILMATNGIARWIFGIANTPESGSNAGGDLAYYRYADNGAYLGYSLLLSRATGDAILSNNLGVGAGAAFGTGATNTLSLYDGTAPSSSPTGVVQLFADTVSSVVELRVRDGAGNVSTQSPHNPQIVDASERITDWVHKEENPYVGYRLEADIFGALEELEKLTGKKFIFIEELPEDKREDWTTNELNLVEQSTKEAEDWDLSETKYGKRPKIHVPRPEPNRLSNARNKVKALKRSK